MMKLKVEYADTGSLDEYTGNARTHSEFQVNQIADSIREFGFVNPILIDGSRTIIAGHGRLAAARLLKIAKVPVIRLDHLSERQRKALVLADNKIALNAGWDFEKLSGELDELAQMDFDLSITGFDEQEIDALLKSTEAILPSDFSEPEKISVKGYERSATAEPKKTSMNDQYGVVVICDGKEEQDAIFEKLVGDGLNCKIMAK